MVDSFKAFSSVCVTGCTREFSRPDKLKSHLLTHSCVKPFTCEICGREFSRKPHYNEHIRGHKGDYPYNCSKCKKGFFRPKLFKEHKCPEGSENAVHQRVFRPRRIKRKPGRPRKIMKKAANSYVDAKEINIVNPGNLHENQAIIEKVVKESTATIGRGKKRARKSATVIEESTNEDRVKKEMEDFDEEDEKKVDQDQVISEGPEVVMTMQNGEENVMYINSIPEQKKTKVSKPECYVKAPSASIAAPPMPVVERYITLHFTTANGCDGGEQLQAQLIATGDLAGQIQFPAGLQAAQLGLQNGGLHPVQIIEGQPYTLAVSQGDSLENMNVESNVIDIPVDIVTVSNDQTLVCSQEEGAEGEGTAQVYEIEDYGAGDTVLQGSENLIDTSVEIIGPENM